METVPALVQFQFAPQILVQLLAVPAFSPFVTGARSTLAAPEMGDSRDHGAAQGRKHHIILET